MGKRNEFHLSFLTWNIYLGADLTPLIPAPTPMAVTQVLRQFLATNFPIRAKAIAREIVSKKPDLIGLQEAIRLELNIPNFSTINYDFIELLLEELKERGLHYEVAILHTNLNLPNIADSNGNTIHFIDRDAILIRKDHRLKIINTQQGTFTANLSGFLRGWSLVDVKLDGQVFRMINTHLEPLNSMLRDSQALELINVPGNTNLPLIITGDLNSIPGSSTYQIFVSAGFQDVWSEVGAGSGFTSYQTPDLLNATSTLNKRIDYILFKNGWSPICAKLVGESQNDRTETGLWPSDHAGVWAKLNLKNHHNHHHEESSD